LSRPKLDFAESQGGSIHPLTDKYLEYDIETN